MYTTRQRLKRYFISIYHFCCIDRLMAFCGIGGFKVLAKKAFRTFMTEKELADKVLLKTIWKDMRLSYCRYLVTPDEYFLFDFKNSNKDKKDSFLSDKMRLRLLLKKVGEKLFVEDLCDKYHLYQIAGDYFKRRVLLLDDDMDRQQFCDFALNVRDLFVKPVSDSFGHGARKEFIDSYDKALRLYNSLVSSGKVFVVEETIKQCGAFASFNDTSVNTIRIPAFLTKAGFHVLAPVMRIGRKGAIVDNAGSGGIIVNIDAATGTLISDGVDEKGHRYDRHPDSGVRFKGFVIPHWRNLLKLVEKVHKDKMPAHMYIGWDFTLSDNGWILIEANWGQFLSQYVDHQGVKSDFIKYISKNPYKI